MLEKPMKLMLAGALALCLAAPGVAEAKNGNKTAAIIAGGLLLGAAALAASSSDYRYRDQYEPAPVYYPPVGAPFSPSRNIICYPRERACYNENGRFKANWTNRVF